MELRDAGVWREGCNLPPHGEHPGADLTPCDVLFDLPSLRVAQATGAQRGDPCKHRFMTAHRVGALPSTPVLVDLFDGEAARVPSIVFGCRSTINSSNMPRAIWRQRESRDFTVPTGIPRFDATCSRS